MNELSILIEKISKKVIEYNSELKKGKFNILKNEIDIILQNTHALEGSGLNLSNSDFHGRNIDLIGLISKYRFPFDIYSNTFRLQILRNLKYFISKEYTVEELGIFLSKEIQSTIDKKKGGFNERILELLRFYVQSYDKVLDNSFEKFIPFLPTHTPKYHELSYNYAQTRFPLTQKYIRTNLLPDLFHFFLAGSIVPYNKETISNQELRGNLLGLLYDDKKNKKFLLIKMSTNTIDNFKNNLIRKIIFFDNLDLFYKNEKYQRYRNKVNNIFILYEDYKENLLTNTATDYVINFYHKKKTPIKPELDMEAFVHIVNTRTIPSDFELHPQLKNYITYRNKVVTLYSSINYFIHIYDPFNKNLDRYADLLKILFENTFSNGFIIQYRIGYLISTHAFRKDFEKVKKEFIEFIWSFKLECEIYENLNFIPFSFFHLPNSKYYSNETDKWDFPIFEEKSITKHSEHLAVNYRQEIKRLENPYFKVRVGQTLERLTREIAEIKKQKQKRNDGKSNNY